MISTTDFRGLFRDLRAILKAPERDVQRSLQAIVETLAACFRSDVCSLYQADPAHGDLFLRATFGLHLEAVGRTRLQIGKGLVGTVAQDLAPLALRDAQADARFLFRPETGEEIYQSFLGVPLIRAETLLGALVIQHREPRTYTAEEIEDCETVAQFLSEMLYPLTDLAQGASPSESHEPVRIPAVPVSPGVGMGRVVLHLKDISIQRWHTSDPFPELARLNAALQELQDSLQSLMQLSDHQSDPEIRELLEADLMLACDKGWREKIERQISEGLSAEAAVQTVRETLRSRMKAVSNDYIRTRLLDLDDLSYRLLAHLTGERPRALDRRLPKDAILLCRSLGTAELLQIGRGRLAGLVVMDATPLSHLAIIAASLDIPTLGQLDGSLGTLRDGDAAIVDAVNGQFIGRPDTSVAKEFAQHLERQRTKTKRDAPKLQAQRFSRDGVALQVTANAGLLLDLENIAALGDIGIGLYRTEVAFLVRSSLPSVQEQTDLYRQVYDRLPGAPIVFRTLDIGSDKALASLEEHRLEANPALGWRAVRMGLDRPELLRDQLRALLSAADDRDLSVMFPMISTLEEFEAARAHLMEVRNDHLAEGGSAPRRLEVGLMIEVPALLWDLDRVFAAADFASVGTNDLFQFLNAADRTNPRIDGRYEPLTSVNLRVLSEIADTAARHGKAVSICGELAASTLGIVALTGCGYRCFSVAAKRVAPAQEVIGALDTGLASERIKFLLNTRQGNLRTEIANLAAGFGLEDG